MNTNQQPPERVVKQDPGHLVVHSIFHTIQGEGPFAGQPAVFVRLAGCNLQCPLCDTEYTAQRTPLNPSTIVEYVQLAPLHRTPLVVITGGEPFRQPIAGLCRALLSAGHTVQIETNGTLYRDDLPYGHENLHIVCSPKTQRVHPDLLCHVTALKYVATADSLDVRDGLPIHALEHPNKGGLYRPPADWKGTIFLQPVDEQDEHRYADNLRAVVLSCQRHGYRLCLQLHKIIGLD